MAHPGLATSNRRSAFVYFNPLVKKVRRRSAVVGQKSIILINQRQYYDKGIFSVFLSLI